MPLWHGIGRSNRSRVCHYGKLNCQFAEFLPRIGMACEIWRFEVGSANAKRMNLDITVGPSVLLLDRSDDYDNFRRISKFFCFRNPVSIHDGRIGIGEKFRHPSTGPGRSGPLRTRSVAVPSSSRNVPHLFPIARFMPLQIHQFDQRRSIRFTAEAMAGMEVSGTCWTGIQIQSKQR
jgi:hypothetical protein